ncbi:unnamed protein product [Paramecium sonneborni]|uniref:Uncharacterized protein n=1 Tax=Paramecium sonneborni TaxID=65129 RepID=A0A8S1QXB0_9CILI|nr:unnamed protein product [Paramecium sonneborni]
MQNKQLKDILNLQVDKTMLVKRQQKGNNDEPIHYGVILTTKNTNSDYYLLHNGYKFGKDQDFVLVTLKGLSKDWEIQEIIVLEKSIKIEVLFSAGCCGQNMRYHPIHNNSKHAQDRILKKVEEYIK